MAAGVAVATDALARYASERFEDSYLYHALGYFMWDVERIPDQAWGRLMWSDQWRRGWKTACEYRRDEARNCRDELSTIAGNLLQVVADYTHTDARVAVAFNLKNQDTRPYLAYFLQGVPAATAHPGGSAPLPVPPSSPGGGPPPVVYPGDNGKLNQLRNEQLPSYSSWLGADDDGHTTSGETFAHSDEDELDRFVQRYGARMRGIDAVVQENDPGAVRPFEQMILPAWLSAPSIVHNHADLAYSLRNSYDERLTSWKTDDATLQAHWDGEAATAYFRHAQTVQAYVERVRAQADWLAGEGHKAGTLLSDLRNAYAGIGYQYIDRMIQQMDEYTSVATSTVARVTECTSPGGAAKALIATVNDFNTALMDQERHSLQAAQDLLRPESMVNSGAPNFDSRNHAAVPYPPEPLNQPSAWDHGAQWHAH
jgi:hypothetical protein